MNAIMTIAESVIIDRLLSNKPPLMGRVKVELGLFASAILLLVIALCFFIYAAYVWLSLNFPPEMAAAIAGGMILSCSALCVITALTFSRHRQKRMQQVQGDIMQTIQTALDVADSEIAKPVQDNPKTSVLIASIIGYAVAQRFL